MSEAADQCRLFFEQHAGDLNKVEALQRSGQFYEWEKYSASRHSPNPVISSERLIRLVINPLHVDPATGDLKPTAVSDVKDKGCSVDRLSHTTLDAAIAAGHENAAAKNATRPDAPPRSVCGVANMSAEDIRGIRVGQNIQPFCVYDTALVANNAHADVCQVVPGNGQVARSARMQLLALADKGRIAIP